MFNAYILKKGFGWDMSIINCVWCGEKHDNLEIKRIDFPVEVISSISPFVFEEFDYAMICPKTKRQIYIRYE